jgi:hypothetical protein
MSISVYMKGDYGKITADRIKKNKANLIVRRAVYRVLRNGF